MSAECARRCNLERLIDTRSDCIRRMWLTCQNICTLGVWVSLVVMAHIEHQLVALLCCVVVRQVVQLNVETLMK